MSGRTTPCQSCGAPMIFAVITGRGRPSSMPLNADPDPGGNVAAALDERGRLVGRVLRAGQEPVAGERRYCPHFATCPRAAQHRRRRRK